MTGSWGLLSWATPRPQLLKIAVNSDYMDFWLYMNLSTFIYGLLHLNLMTGIYLYDTYGNFHHYIKKWTEPKKASN